MSDDLPPITRNARIMELRREHGGVRNCVTIMVPQASRQVVAAAMRYADQIQARFVGIADTCEQADRIAQRARKLTTPGHVRISHERAAYGKWGRLS
jgi:hypothetical protein